MVSTLSILRVLLYSIKSSTRGLVKYIVVVVLIKITGIDFIRKVFLEFPVGFFFTFTGAVAQR